VTKRREKERSFLRSSDKMSLLYFYWRGKWRGEGGHGKKGGREAL